MGNEIIFYDFNELWKNATVGHTLSYQKSYPIGISFISNDNG